jgi:hypothetical protein
MRLFSLISLIFIFGSSGIQAADLQPETLRAWNANVEKIEWRISSELSSNSGFFSLDFQNPAAAAKERHQVLSGKFLSADR